MLRTKMVYFLFRDDNNNPILRQSMTDENGFELSYEDVIISQDEYDEFGAGFESAATVEEYCGLGHDYWEKVHNRKEEINMEESKTTIHQQEINMEESKTIEHTQDILPSYPQQMIDIFKEVCSNDAIKYAEITFTNDGEFKLSINKSERN